MLGTAKHGHEAGSLLEEIAKIFSLLVQHAVSPLDRIGALQKVRLRFPVAADLAKTVMLRHIDGVLEDMAQFSVAILDGRMRCATGALCEIGRAEWGGREWREDSYWGVGGKIK